MQNPLHNAITNNNLARIKDLKNHALERDSYGFTVLELAQHLGHEQALKILRNDPQRTFKVQLKDLPHPVLLNQHDFEHTFNLIYRPYLTFVSYTDLISAAKNCPFILRYKWLAEHHAEYLSKISHGHLAKIYVKWINPALGYGLFADVDIPKETFIAEYTGVVRRLYRNHPDHNGYCFHYPTRFWSVHYHAIDSLGEGNLARFINHSDTPNLKPVWVVHNRLLHLVFIANKDIKKDSQLNFDYGQDFWRHREKA